MKERFRNSSRLFLQRYILSDTKSIGFVLKIFLLSIYLKVFEYGSRVYGSLWSSPSKMSVFAQTVGNYFNLNHLGNVYATSESNLGITRKIEKKVIEWNKRLIHCQNEEVEGYVTNGGSEANLFLMWMGREKGKKEYRQKPKLLCTDFVHYSISKAANILEIPIVKVRHDEEKYRMDILDLQNKIIAEARQGVHYFLIPITLGYSSTGSFDSLAQIIVVVEKLQRELGVHCFIWVDAAAQGLPKSFLEKKFTPMSTELVQGYVVDFHKYGDVAVPAGVVLYRSELRKYIESNIPYLEETDATLSGSRPGASALAIWSVLGSRNHADWLRKFQKLERDKNQFIEDIHRTNPEVKIISTRNSLTFAVEKNSQQIFSENFLEQNYIVTTNISNFEHYKIHIT